MLGLHEAARLLERAEHHRSLPLPTAWADTLGVDTVGQMCTRIYCFAHDLRLARASPTPPRPADLAEVYWGTTGVPSVDTLRAYLDTSCRHLRDILDHLDNYSLD